MTLAYFSTLARPLSSLTHRFLVGCQVAGLPVPVRRDGGDMALAQRYADAVSIPMNDQTMEETQGLHLFKRGQFRVRQEMWETLSAEIRQHDLARDATSGGTALADLLAYGARADVVRPVEAALSDPALMAAHAPRAGICALEEVLQDHAGDHGVALVVAHTHIDVGWAWRGQGWDAEVPHHRSQAFHSHFDRAGDILDGFDAFELNSPALAAARCALLAASPAPQARVADDYEDLIDLDPGNPRHMRCLGNHLLPRWFGDYDQLELEARRSAARTGDIWGAGAYTWVHLDALTVDPGAFARLDVPFFLDGLRDILMRRRDQHVANLWASFCAVTLAQPRYDAGPIAAAAREVRGALDWILRDHLTEVHPLVWGIAARPGQAGGSREDMARLGQICALARIGRHFDRDLRRGKRVVWDSTGPRLEHARG